MKVYNNNLERILTEFAITQVELSDASDLSINTISRAYRRIGNLAPESKNSVTHGINKCLKERKIKKSFSVDDIFSLAKFGKI